MAVLQLRDAVTVQDRLTTTETAATTIISWHGLMTLHLLTGLLSETVPGLNYYKLAKITCISKFCLC